MTAAVRHRTALKAAAIIAAVLTAVLSLVCVNSFAAADYIDTWNKYKESGGASATWNDVADAMDKVFAAADQLYAEGDSDGAQWDTSQVRERPRSSFSSQLRRQLRKTAEAQKILKQSSLSSCR